MRTEYMNARYCFTNIDIESRIILKCTIKMGWDGANSTNPSIH
jgi:hypothetical protein